MDKRQKRVALIIGGIVLAYLAYRYFAGSGSSGASTSGVPAPSDAAYYPVMGATSSGGDPTSGGTTPTDPGTTPTTSPPPTTGPTWPQPGGGNGPVKTFFGYPPGTGVGGVTPGIPIIGGNSNPTVTFANGGHGLIGLFQTTTGQKVGF